MKLRKWLASALIGAALLLPSLAIGAEIGDLDISDAANTARWPEGMAPSAVNDAGRADEGILARWYADTNCSTASSGSPNAYSLSTSRTITAYYDGLQVCFDANFTNTGAATLDVNGIGQVTIKKNHDQDLASGDIESGGKYLAVYDGTYFQLLSITAAGNQAYTDADNSFTTDQTITSTDSGASEGPGVNTYRNSTTPAVDDQAGPVRFKGNDSALNSTTYCKVLPVIADPTDGSEDAYMRLDCEVAGTLTPGFHVGPSLYAHGNTDPGTGNISVDDAEVTGDLAVTGDLTTGGDTVDLTITDTPQAGGSTLTFTAPFTTVNAFEIVFDQATTDPTLGDSGGVEVTGYVSEASAETGSGSGSHTSSTTSCDTYGSGGEDGIYHFALADSSNTWIGTMVDSSGNIAEAVCRKQLSGALTTIEVTPSGGSVNVRWHGHN